MFPDFFIDDLKNRVSIREVISKRTKLTKRGNNLFGLCPFHNEKSPSFSVSEDKGFYHCFGCNAQGDVINFVQQTEGLTFNEAVEALATRSGLQLPQQDELSGQREQYRNRLLAAIEAAAKWYEAQLKSGAGNPSREYLEKRGLTQETITKFRLGYAPDRKGQLVEHLKQQGFNDEEVGQIGVLGKRDDGSTYDYFRDRLIFPIMDAQGRVISFGGRTLTNAEPKYLNGPDAPLFNKRTVLYGLSFAKSSVRSANMALVVEGYMDVIALHQAGFTQAVAPLGTALSPEHLALLWRHCDDPILCFDGDSAGQRAANRCIDVALPIIEAGKSVRFITLPQDEDPDSLIQSSGAAAFHALLQKAEPMAARLFKIEAAQKPLSSPEERADLLKRLNKHTATMKDMQLKSFYRDFFNAEVSKLIQTARFKKGQKKWGSAPSFSTGRGLINPDRLFEGSVKGLFTAILNYPDLLDQTAEHLPMLADMVPALNHFMHALHDVAAQQHFDATQLHDFLTERGFAETIRDLTEPSILTLCPFARKGNELQTVTEKWFEIFHALIEKQGALDEPAPDNLTTDEGWERFVKSKQDLIG